MTTDDRPTCPTCGSSDKDFYKYPCDASGGTHYFHPWHTSPQPQPESQVHQVQGRPAVLVDADTGEPQGEQGPICTDCLCCDRCDCSCHRKDSKPPSDREELLREAAAVESARVFQEISRKKGLALEQALAALEQIATMSLGDHAAKRVAREGLERARREMEKKQ